MLTSLEPRQAPNQSDKANAIDFDKFYNRSHDAVIRAYDEAGNVIETHKHAGEFGVTDYSEAVCGVQAWSIQ